MFDIKSSQSWKVFFESLAFLFSAAQDSQLGIWRKCKKSITVFMTKTSVQYMSLWFWIDFFYWNWTDRDMNTFLTISCNFSTPKKCSDLEFHCYFVALHLEKLEKNNFPDWKKNVPFGKLFFPFGTIIFPIFPHKKTGKVKKIFCSSVILNFSRVLRPRKVNLKNITNS